MSEASGSAGGSATLPLRLIRGEASAEEVAAIVAVLAAAGTGEAEQTAAVTPASRWAAPAGRVRAPHSHGPGAWRASALPR